MATPSPNSYVFTPGVTLYAGMATPSGGTTLTTITLANTSATEQSAGFVSPMFGLPLKQGDVPAGQYPAFFLSDDTPVPATIHSVTSWPDGSMKWCGVFLRVPTTVAGSGTLAITVKNGGSAPGSSARALSDFTAANLSVELTGITNLSGVWASTLNDAITNGTAVQIADGPAGAIWRVLGDFKQSGSAHGQLVCWHYVAALQNASGGLLGVRYLGRVAQPWCDVTSPTATSRVVSGVVKVGASTLRGLQGYTTDGGALGSSIRLPHYGSFFTAGIDGKWDFVQGGGSASADCTIRVVHDAAYLVGSKMTPPVDLTLSPAAESNIDYYPMGNAGMLMGMTTGGGRQDIGVWPAWAVRHLLLQSTATEKRLRAAALAAGGWRFCVRKLSTKELVPVAATQASFPGLGAPETTWRKMDGDNYITGFVAPVDNVSPWVEDTGHRPAPAFPAYLLTGEPQYYDLVMETAFSQPQSCYTGTGVQRTTRPLTKANGYTISGYSGERTTQVLSNTYPGSGMMFWDAGLRIVAWSIRDVASGAAVALAPHKTYLDDLVSNSFGAAADYVANQPTSYRNAGFYWRRQTDGTHEAPWMYNHLCMSTSHCADVTQNASAAAFRSHLAKFHEGWVDAGSSPVLLTAFRYAQFKESDICDTLGDCVLEVPGSLVFTASTGRVTTSTVSWTPTNGDAVAFSTNGISSALPPISGAANDRRYYVVNASGGTFQLSETLGGAAVSFTGDATVTGYFANVKQLAASEVSKFDAEYVAILNGTISWFSAAGEPVVSALAASETLLSTRGVDRTSQLPFAMTSER